MFYSTFEFLKRSETVTRSSYTWVKLEVCLHRKSRDTTRETWRSEGQFHLNKFLKKTCCLLIVKRFFSKLQLVLFEKCWLLGLFVFMEYHRIVKKSADSVISFIYLECVLTQILWATKIKSRNSCNETMK